jgi:hypothetical protein
MSDLGRMKLNDWFALAIVAMAAIPLFASGCSTAGAVVTEPPEPKPLRWQLHPGNR